LEAGNLSLEPEPLLAAGIPSLVAGSPGAFLWGLAFSWGGSGSVLGRSLFFFPELFLGQRLLSFSGAGREAWGLRSSLFRVSPVLSFFGEKRRALSHVLIGLCFWFLRVLLSCCFSHVVCFPLLPPSVLLFLSVLRRVDYAAVARP